MVNYANFHQSCIDTALTPFMQYLPFVLLVQAVIIILIEKLLMKFPRVAGKIERFYNTIVEEALFGKDPDVAEDVQDDKGNVEIIARRRRRNEVCVSLKRSSVIHNTYILKNIVQIFVLLTFIPFNIYFAVNSQHNLRPSKCVVNILEFPELDLYEEGQIFYVCEGKKVNFLLNLQFIQIAALSFVLLCSCGSIIWCVGFRSVSQLLEKIAKHCHGRMKVPSLDDVSHTSDGIGMKDVNERLLEKTNETGDAFDVNIDLTKTGKDFLFLFDLLAHTAGIESTLRVLTHADETFRKICLPKLQLSEAHIREDKLKVRWRPASLESWLETNQHKGISIDSYDVTIFPSESIKNSVTKYTGDKDSSGYYSTTFQDLQGGKTEYIVTIACVIGKSRMKGERIVTTLPPYGPEKPRGGRIFKHDESEAKTEEVEIEWEPPKGGFTKYVLFVDSNVQPSTKPISRQLSNYYKNMDVGSSASLRAKDKDFTERELNHSLTSYKITGLLPGEAYRVSLLTKTGTRFTNHPVMETVMTAPHRVRDYAVSAVACTKATITWTRPDSHHTRLRGFNFVINSNDGKYKRDFTQFLSADKIIQSHDFYDLQPATEYKVAVRAVCLFELLKTKSEEDQVTFCTLPEPPGGLSLESRYPNSLTVRWSPAPLVPGLATHRHRLSLENPDIGHKEEISHPGDKTTYTFSKLQDGETYRVRIEYVVTPFKSETEVSWIRERSEYHNTTSTSNGLLDFQTVSDPLSGKFTTKPLPPTNFRLGCEQFSIMWTRSPTVNVRYRVLKMFLKQKSKLDLEKVSEFNLNYILLGNTK